MKGTLILVLLLTLISFNESSISLGGLLGGGLLSGSLLGGGLLNSDFISQILRADIIDIITCILHNNMIIYDVNIIIDAILTKDFNKIIVALSQVATNLIDEVKSCINNPTAKLLR